MTEKNVLMALKQLSWIVTVTLCWLYAARGHGSEGTRTFNIWFWGVAWCIDLLLFVSAIVVIGRAE